MRIDAQLLAAWPLPVEEHGDKHARGTVLVLGGSSSTVGAVLLGGLAALRMGAGRLQIGVAAPVATALGIAVPEAMVVELPHHRDGTLRPHLAARQIRELVEGAASILVGPGFIAGPATLAFVEDVLAAVGPETIVVLDAAAMPAITAVDERVGRALRDRIVLTPNRQEAAQLVSACGGDDRTEAGMLLSVARACGASVSSFGTVVDHDGRRWDAGDGGPGLGTSGSGDVLAGLVAGAAARCAGAAQAACWATYVHTIIGQQLSSRMGRLSFIARELLDEVAQVMATLEPA